MYNISVSENDIQLIRWCVQVAGDTLAMQEESHITAEEALGFISQLEILDESLVNQVKPQREEILRTPHKPRYEQTRLPID